MGTVQCIADPFGQFLRWQQSIGFDHPPLGVAPLGFNRIEPRTLDRQRTDQQPHPLPAGLDLSVMSPDPVPHGLAAVPGGIVPDQRQHAHAARRRFLTAPVEEGGRRCADWPAVEEAQPDIARPGQQQAIAGQRLAVGIVARDRLLNQPQRLVPIRPGAQGGAGDAAPPDLVLEAEEPVRLTSGEGDQAVALSFFRAYSGSGLVIQCLARTQRTPSRAKVARTVSPVTRLAVSPWRWASAAARSSVHRLVG